MFYMCMYACFAPFTVGLCCKCCAVIYRLMWYFGSLYCLVFKKALSSQHIKFVFTNFIFLSKNYINFFLRGILICNDDINDDLNFYFLSFQI